MAKTVTWTFTTSSSTIENLCKLAVFGNYCVDKPYTITEDPGFSGGETTFDLLAETYKNISLPTLIISPAGCYITTWTVHLHADGSDMTVSKPSVFTIAD
jgi:hypothetical protein